MATGFGQGLAALLGVGNSRAAAFDEGQKTAADIGFRSAQTEGALASAREAQAKALAQERVNALRGELARNPAAIANADNETLGRLILSDLGSNYSSAQEGRLRQQQFGNRETAADPTASALDRTRALQAVEGKPSADVVKVGKGYVNLTDDKQKVQFLGDELAADLSTAAKNFNFEQDLRKAQGLPPLAGQEAVNTFREQSRAERIVNAGGVQTGALSGQPVVDPNTVANNVGTIAGAKTKAVGEAKRELDLPAAKSRLASFTKKASDAGNLAREIQGNESLWQSVGPTQVIAAIPGTEGAKIRAQVRTLKSKLTLGALQELRDNSKTGGALGNVSNRDLIVLEDQVAALDANLSVGDFRQQLQTVIEYMDDLGIRLTDAFYETYPALRGGQAPAASGNPPARTNGAPVPATPTAPPKAGTVEDGYRFKGGNPADPKNWEPA